MDRLKRYFIPSEVNQHQPYLLREGSIGAVLIIIVLLEAAVVIPSFFLLPRSSFLAPVWSESLVQIINRERGARQLKPLVTNNLLNQAAELAAEDMARRSYFSHQSPEGLAPWVWLNQVGYRFADAGQYLAVNFFDSEDLVKAWLKLGQAQISLDKHQFTETGIGVASGRFQGRDGLYVVQFFARPLSGISPTATISHPDYWQLLSVRLHTLSSRIYVALLWLSIIALILNLLINFRLRQPHILVNVLLLILVILAVLFVNDQFFVSKAQISYLETSASTTD